jgi:hypothetical protein
MKERATKKKKMTKSTELIPTIEDVLLNLRIFFCRYEREEGRQRGRGGDGERGRGGREWRGGRGRERGRGEEINILFACFNNNLQSDIVLN